MQRSKEKLPFIISAKLPEIPQRVQLASRLSDFSSYFMRIFKQENFFGFTELDFRRSDKNRVNLLH